jgi:phage baseplate assembly protein W
MAVGNRAILFAHPDFRSDASGLGFAPTGGLRLISGTQSIRQALLILLTTVPGERIMRADYGCDLYRLIFSPNDDTTAGLAIFYVRRAIERYERRVDIVELDAAANANMPNQLDITLIYRVRETLRTDTLELPVRLEGAES